MSSYARLKTCESKMDIRIHMQRCPSDSDTVITVNNTIYYCLVKTEYDVTSPIIELIMCTVSLVPGVGQTGEA